MTIPEREYLVPDDLTEKEVYDCRDCRVWDPTNQGDVQRELERDPTAYADRIFWTVRNGVTLDCGGGVRIPLYTDMLLCAAHERRVREANE